MIFENLGFIINIITPALLYNFFINRIERFCNTKKSLSTATFRKGSLETLICFEVNPTKIYHAHILIFLLFV